MHTGEPKLVRNLQKEREVQESIRKITAPSPQQSSTKDNETTTKVVPKSAPTPLKRKRNDSSNAVKKPAAKAQKSGELTLITSLNHVFCNT